MPVIQHHDVQVRVIDLGHCLEGRPHDLHRLIADGDQQVDIRQFPLPFHGLARMEALLGKHVGPDQDADEADQLGQNEKAGGDGMSPIQHAKKPLEIDDSKDDRGGVKDPVLPPQRG